MKIRGIIKSEHSITKLASSSNEHEKLNAEREETVSKINNNERTYFKDFDNSGFAAR